ncbi:SpoIIE family protein phosphatase [Streptomyces antimicrobicus]|uniref:SpoIIE family protein phosphatase n=1 Tax=Streptomyces antimicrobicus TaxID=2883108 RepID=A0ABS8B3W5_9ACTN|nr:SpoIIE family protein phosphatase [Streptomyces antimicrobicus]MCB5179291.1 SpoIIE family protein phosphatase [Streptomyces antimicrobicus]
MAGRADDGPGPVLARATVGAVEAVGGFAGGVYLCSATPKLLKLAVLAGLPAQLFEPWWHMIENRPFPVAEAHRTGQAVLLADAEAAMRRFPQLMAGLPYPFGSLYEPLAADGRKFGVLMVLRPPTPGRPVGPSDRRRLREAAARLTRELARLADLGVPVCWEADPLGLQLPQPCRPPPGPAAAPFEWAADEPAPEALTAGWAAEDRLGLSAAAGALAEGRPGRAYVLPVQDGRARPHAVELHGGDGHRVRAGAFPVPPGAAADRLPQAVVGLDRLGRVSYVNRAARELLGPEPAGQVLWEALPWLGGPAHEDHFRAVFMSGDPVEFVARHPYGVWQAVALHADRAGVTLQLTSAEQPVYAPGSVVRPGGGLGSPADRASALYRPVALAIALTEAVTARQVSAVVTEELLPAFGGRQLAIYLLSEQHLHLAWETGFPAGFLDRFDGVGLDARLPGVETLTTGRPIFFESMQQLAAAYPGIPLDADVGARAFLPLIASGRPVGSCILGFDAPRGFSPEERTVLTALAGLIAQALERAQRYDTEAALARGLQAALLPNRLPVLPHVDTVGRYLPGTQGLDVGGDWYDVIETGDGLLALVIGDVQGHGVAAAATMGQLRSAVRAFALSGNAPEQVVGGTNRLLIDLDPGQFASCCYVLLDPATGAAQAVRAGHPQPLLRAPDGRTEVLDLPGGVVLGVDGEAAYPVAELVLGPGSVLALYTDGLVEQPGEDIDHGVDQLRAVLASAGPGPLTETADRLISEAGRAADRPDDIALLLACRTGR